MLLLALFVLISPVKSWADETDVTWDGKTEGCMFPSGSSGSPEYSTKNGITITTNCPAANAYVANRNPQCYNYEVAPAGNYIDITTSGQVLTNVNVSIVYIGGSGANSVKISFSSGDSFDGDALLGSSPYTITGTNDQQGDVTCEIVAPYGAKSARIYRTDTGWGPYLHRIRVIAQDACASPETATFAAGGGGNPTGAAPSDISACEGAAFTMPNAGTLTWPGYSFTGWKLNNAGDLITAGTSYTMPAGGASFTAQWEVYVEPNIAEWGDYGDPAIDFPSSSSSSTTLYGIDLAYSVAFSSGGVGWYSSHTYYWVFDDNKYCDITLASSYSSQVISEVSACVWYTGYGSAPEMYIQFYSSVTCTDGYEIGTPQLITGQAQTASTLSTHSPSSVGAKSARIYSNGEAFMCRLIVTREDACSTLSASFTKAGSETGNVPGDLDVCEGGTFTIPDAGTLTWSHHAFLGWNDGANTYAAGASYTMGNADVAFTAVWEEQVVPAVTNLNITDKENSNVPLSWKIPGICDLSNPVAPSHNMTGTITSNTYDATNDNVTSNGDSPAWEQYGVAFNIPSTTNIEWMSFDYIGHGLVADIGFWGGLNDANYSYWNDNSWSPTSDETWENSGQLIPSDRFWHAEAVTTPLARSITQVAIYANSATQDNFNQSFSVRNVRYHVHNQLDIDHVVVLRKEGSAATGIDDAAATQLYSGTKSHYTDTEVKTVGSTYYYTVYAVDADGYVSAATTVSATITNDTPHTVTYAKGGDGVTGSVPTDANTYVEGNNVTLAAIGDLEWTGHIFLGWSDGTDTYQPGNSYTMSDDDVIFTAQWRDIETPLLIPTGTTHLDANNYYSIPGGIYSFDVDGTGASTCIDIAGNNYAEWKAKFTPGHYRATLTYGTTAWAVDVILKIYDGETEVKATAVDHHSDGSGVHTYQRTWGLDLTDLDPDKVYKVRVIDAYSDASSNPKVGYLDFEIVVPTDISNTASTRLDYTNVSVDPGTVEFDIKNDGNSVTCLDIKDHGQADWYVYITPDVYDINMLYGTPEYSTNVTFSIIDPSTSTTVFAPAALTHSGAASTPWYEEKTWNNVDLSGLTAGKQYIVRVVDTYSSTGSKPKVQYITFSKHEVIQIGAFETVLNKDNTISTVSTVTDIDIDGDGNNDACMNLRNTYAEWEVNITRGVYTMMLEYGVSTTSGSALKVQIDLIDPSGVEATRRLLYHNLSNDANNQSMAKIATRGCDFSEITEGKRYIIRVTDAYPNCKLRVRNLTFAPFSPVQIPTTPRLNASNVFTPDVFAYNNFDVDGDDANDECLYIRNHETQGVSPAEWKVNITPGIYKMNVVYGAPSGNSYDITVSLVDPEVGGEGTQLYTKHVSGSASIVRQNETVSDIDWTNLTAGKEYIIRVASVNGSTTGNKLYFGSMSFERKQVHTRSGLRVGDFGTICLPYAVAAEDRNGAELFEIDEWSADGNSLTISELNADENMIAGRPYIFQATAATATFSYYPEGSEAEAGEYNGLIGSYTQEVIAQDNNNYIIYNNKLYPVNDLAYVGANRAYIHRTAATTPTPAPRRRVTLFLNGTQTATGLDGIQSDNNLQKVLVNGQLFIIRDGKTYTVQGQLVTR